MFFSISIRPALASDIADLIPLFEELDEYHRLALPAVFRKPAGARREPSWLDWLIAGPDQAILLAERPQTEIVGLAVLIARSVAANSVRDARRFVEIDQLVVAGAARRRGVGRSLIEASKAWGRARGISNLEVSAWSVNAETIKFYRRIGFSPTIERFAMSSV
jgi:ribosomal protein S18 acetylase RimI-like enzyme